MDSLDSLRARLGEIDRYLLRLISERQQLVGDIGRTKAAQGLPVRDFAQEKAVHDRAARSAAEMGLAPVLAEKLTRLLIEAALTEQERDRVAVSGHGESRRVLVIGGAGRMGRWMTRFLASQGFKVEVADPAGEVPGFSHRADWREGDLDQDVIVVAAPLRQSRDILASMAAQPPPGLIFDIGSLKSPLREPLTRLAANGARITSIHPMFGPDTELLLGRHVVFVDVGSPESTREARALFDSTLARQVEMDLDLHDRYIAYVLGLSHALNIAFSNALAESGEHAEQLADFSSTTFDAQFHLAAGVAQENPHLYFEIQSLNDYGLAPLEALVAASTRIRDLVREGDESGFVALMEQGRAYLALRGE